MKTSLNWLTDYVDISLSAQQLADLLMRAGLPVESIEETDSDIVLDVEVTSNRPDCLGHIGIAREVAAVTGKALRLPDLSQVPASGQIVGQAAVEVLGAEFCPRYTARLLRGVKIGPSPKWMVERLEAVGLRSVNNVVDATNYVLMEYSQPLHAFDFDKLGGHKIVVRRARDGEQIVAIDGSKHELRGWMGIIADEKRPVAVAGVMGGLETEVTSATVNVLIESAVFDPLSIRRASRSLNLMSDSSYRFERGIDPVALERASLRACELILKTAGGELVGGIVDVWDKPHQAATVVLRPERTSKILGIEVPLETQRKILESLGLAPRVEAGNIVCTIPTHRSDLTREIDLIEEVARIHGFEKIPTGGAVTHRVHAPSRLESARRAVGEVLNAAGYFEAVTFTFIDAEEAALFGWNSSLAVDTRIRKTNNLLRRGLLPSLLRARKANQDAAVEQVSLFELSAVFPPQEGTDDADSLPQEHTQLGLLTDGSPQDIRGAVEAVVRRFNPAVSVVARAAEIEGFAPGAAAELTLELNGEPVANNVLFGVMGQLDAKVCDFYGLTLRPSGAMVRFDQLISLAQSARKYSPVPRFPAIKRDLSVVVDEPLTWQAIDSAATSAAGDLCAGVEYVGAYRGKQVGAGKKSLTMRLTFRHQDRTLRHDEVDAAMQDVIARMKQLFAAELRA